MIRQICMAAVIVAGIHHSFAQGPAVAPALEEANQLAKLLPVQFGLVVRLAHSVLGLGRHRFCPSGGAVNISTYDGGVTGDEVAESTCGCGVGPPEPVRSRSGEGADLPADVATGGWFCAARARSRSASTSIFRLSRLASSSRGIAAP